MKTLLFALVLGLSGSTTVLHAGDTINYAPPPPLSPERARAWTIAQEIQRAINDHQVVIGMTAAQCIESWGPPQKINRTTTANGGSEQWVYRSNYLYMDNGILTAIQN